MGANLKNPRFLYTGFYCSLNIDAFVFFLMLNLKFDRILTINLLVLFSESFCNCFCNCLLAPNTANAVKLNNL